MSKKSKTTAQVQPLSDNKRKAIIITAIILVAAIILTVALTLILRPATRTPADQTTPGSGSSSLPIRNGDFYYTGSDDTAYPKTAQYWSRKGYEAISGNTHNFSDLSGSDEVVMGIVTTATDGDGDTWDTVLEDLSAEGITDVTNPGKHDSELADDNVYMIATKTPSAASIFSDMITVSSGKSVKITVWLNTAQLKEGSKAVVMLQKNTTNAKSENWYAYNFEVEHDTTKEDAQGWQSLEFHIFNRDNSSKYLRLCIGLGNVYSGEEGLDLLPGTTEDDADQPIKGEGVLFIDDITYEEVTANEYRETVDGENIPEHSFKVLENEDIDEESIYLDWDVLDSKTPDVYTEAKDFADKEGGYSPFTNKDDFYKDIENSDDDGNATPDREETGFKIFALSHDGSTDRTGFRLNASMLALNNGTHHGINTEYNLWQKDYHHISFWVRVNQVNKLAKINIYVQSYNDQAEGEDKWENVDNGSWTAQVGSQEIDTDSNCGWVKYDIYLKPDTVQHEISVIVTLGSKDGYNDGELIPDGKLYITTPTYENISAKDYNNASSGTYSKKLDLIGDSYSPDITNGSFSTAGNNGDQPTSWTPVFAGDNMLYRDGKGNDEIPDLHRVKSAVEYGLKRNYTAADGNHGHDDAQNNVLYINNKKSTSFGFMSSSFTLNAHTVYSFSFLVKGDPYFYIFNNSATDDDGNTIARGDRVIAKVTSETAKPTETQQKALGFDYTTVPLQNDWQNYNVVLITGDESLSVRILLFNGSLDGTTLKTGEIYYDHVDMTNLGTYSMVDDPDLEEGEEAEKYVVNWSLNSSYELDGEALTIKDFLTGTQLKDLVAWGAYSPEDDEEIGENPENGALSGLVQSVPTESEWTEMLKVPESDDSDDDDSGNVTETESTPVDLGLLFSVISSVALVAALLVVIVVKIFRNKKNQNKAA